MNRLKMEFHHLSPTLLLGGCDEITQWFERLGSNRCLPMSRLVGLQLLIVALVTIVMGHFLLNRREEWTENVNHAFSQAWADLREGMVDSGMVAAHQDVNNNNIEVEDHIAMDGVDRVQSVWGEDSFREDNDHNWGEVDGVTMQQGEVDRVTLQQQTEQTEN